MSVLEELDVDALGCIEHQLVQQMCEESLYDFTRTLWPVVESQPFIDNWHIRHICEHLQAVTAGEIEKLVINVPPGCSKSLLTCVFWPMWEWARDASVRWFFASYDQRLSTRDSVKCRALLASPQFRSMWGDRFRLTHDQNQKTYYETDKGGYRLATSVGGHGTGEHPDRIVYDDPHNVKQAESETERQGVIDWHDLTMSTRGVARKARRVIIMQRLHEQDMTGHVLTQGGWVHICLCMRHERGRMPDTPLYWNDPRAAEGELLSPLQFPEDAVAEMEKNLGLYGTASQLQQRPTPRKGGMFEEEFFNKRVKSAPFECRRVRFWDRACLVAGTMVETDRGQVPIEKVRAGDRVLTRVGYRAVTWSGKTKEVSELVEVRCSNGSVIAGTADHPLWVEGQGWVELVSVRCGSYASYSPNWRLQWQDLGTLNSNRSCLAGCITPGSPASGTTPPVATTRGRSGAGRIRCTARSGGTTTARSRQGTTFITSITTPITTTSATWPVSPGLSTIVFTMPLVNGTRHRRRRSCVSGTGRSAGGTCLTAHSNAGSAGPNSKAGTQTRPGSSSALASAGSGSRTGRPSGPASAAGDGSPGVPGLTTVLSVERRWAGRPVPVYDLTVEGEHEFYANGILVHNSTQDGGCFTAGVLLGKNPEGAYYIEHVEKGQWAPAERNAKMRACALRDRSRYGPTNEPVIWIEREGGASGRDAWLMAVRALEGFAVKEYNVAQAGNKEARAEPWSSQLAAGNVYVVDNGESRGAGKAEWDINSYVKEHCAFPKAALKDQVDASSGAFAQLVNVGARKGPLLRIYTLGAPKQNQIKVVVCNTDSLAVTLVEQRSVLVSVQDPGKVPAPPVHGLCKLQEHLVLQFADLDPAALQHCWDEPLAPFNAAPKDLVMSREHGKKLWGLLTRRRADPPQVYVFHDDAAAPNRAMSVAMAFCDANRLRYGEAITAPHVPDSDVGGPPPNRHVYEVTKLCRNMVM